MQLEPEQIERFYRIWWPLLVFVNEKRHLVSGFSGPKLKKGVRPEDAVIIRDTLWADDSLLEAFIEENPAALSDDDLKLAASWRHRVAGRFLILRHLKNYSVFLDETESHAYGVLGLVSSFEEFTGPELPRLVQAVLIPFEDKIIYDSLIIPYNVYFGSGIRGNIELAFRNIQEREGIITSLGPAPVSFDPEARKRFISDRNKKLLAAFRKELFKSGLSPKMVERHEKNIAAFGDHLIANDPPRLLVEIKPHFVKDFLDHQDEKDRKPIATSFKRFTRFLYETVRLEPEPMWDIKEILKLYEPARGKRIPRSNKKKGLE